MSNLHCLFFHVHRVFVEKNQTIDFAFHTLNIDNPDTFADGLLDEPSAGCAPGEITLFSETLSPDERIPLFLQEIERAIVFVYDNSQVSLLNDLLLESGYNTLEGAVIDLRELMTIFFPMLDNYDLQTVNAIFASDADKPDAPDTSSSFVRFYMQICRQLIGIILDSPLLLVQRIGDLYKHNQQSLISYFLSMMEQSILAKPGAMALPGNLFSNQQILLKKLELPVFEDVHHEHPETLLQVFQHQENDQKDQSVFEKFEMRPQQQQMLEQVLQAVTDKKHLLVEAGTGTGKTMAYLLPMLYHSLTKGEKVVVSTHTILLQRQIIDRDIPLLRSIYGEPFEVALFKGRSHYFCLRKFAMVSSRPTDHKQLDSASIGKLFVWLTQTETGDGEELQSQNQSIWQHVNSDSETCLNKRCHWFSQCFYHMAKERTHHANMIITNHSMIFSDLKAEHQILPAYQYIVFDEAHHMENEATKHLGIKVQYYEVKRALTYLYKDHRSGLLSNAKEYINLLGAQELDAYEELPEILTTMGELVVQYKLAFDEFVSSVHAWLQTLEKDNALASQTLRIRNSHREQFPHYSVLENVAASSNLLQRQFDRLDRAHQSLDDVNYRVSEYVKEILSQKKVLLQMQQQLQFFFHEEDPDYVYWIEYDQEFRYNQIAFYAVPIDIGIQLNDKLFTKKASCILTSATLAIRGSFKYAIKRLGLSEVFDNGDIYTLALDSPFDYQRQCLVCIPNDIPFVRSEAQFVEKTGDIISQLVIQQEGSTLLLFTSNHLLQKMYVFLQEKFKDSPVKLLGQNIDGTNRAKLIEQFQTHRQAVLLGTNSFWEGIDLPGHLLTCVCIIKLPFWPPNLPVIAARAEQIEKQQGNSFLEYSLPEAIIRFKQGFGRLIRTKYDRGTVIVFDRRIIDNYYGKYFLQALPNPQINVLSAGKLAEAIDEWNLL